MRVLGIDPGYDRLGIAVIEKDRRGKESVVYSACLTTTKASSLPGRFREVGEAIEDAITLYSPQKLAMETLFFNTNQTTAINVAGVRGIILYLASKHGLTFEEFTPLQVKIAVTGYGRSDKGQVQSMIERLVVLPKAKRLDDEYDAIAVALTALAHARS
jgi:crossover junction endodeoxyribonuclease RuvC